MNKKKILIASLILISIILIIAILFWFFYPRNQGSSQEDFSLNYALLKSVIKQGESSSLDLKISPKEKDNFNLKLQGLGNLAYLSEDSFSADESKLIRISFNGGSSPGVYAGSLYIESCTSNKTIPAVLEIQSPETPIVVNLELSQKYREILRGGEVLFDINIFNLKAQETNSVTLEYAVNNLEGEIIKLESEVVTVGSNLKFTKTMHLPSNIELGNHVLSVTLKYKDYTATSSSLVEVVNVKKSFFQRFDIFSILVIILLLAIVIVIIYMLRERNKLFLSLERQHQSQINSISRNIEKQKHKSLNKVKTESQRRKVLSKFESAKRKILEKMKSEQKRQRKELEELKKKGNQKIINQKMNEWKNRGTSEALKSADIDSGLKSKLEALESARVGGFISRNSYLKGKRRITKRLR